MSIVTTTNTWTDFALPISYPNSMLKTLVTNSYRASVYSAAYNVIDSSMKSVVKFSTATLGDLDGSHVQWVSLGY